MRRLAIAVLAFCAAIAPFPPVLIEQHYSRGIYPPLQHALTRFSNAAAFAYFDALLVAAGFILLAVLLRRGRVLNVLCFAAVVWILFLITWGLNYRRVPLSDSLSYEAARVNARNVAVMARTAVTEMNRLHAEVRKQPAASVDSVAESLAPAMERAAADLALPAPLPGRPKHTWLAGYFRAAGIDGMTDPFFLETLLLSDLLDVEQPAALAHEWGHLAGLAHEAEASFFGWLTCLRGDARAQYSGWVALYPHLVGALPDDERAAIHRRLDAGPREDFARIARRIAEADERVRAAATGTYDKFLRANRVAEGVRSYDAVVRLVVGTSYSGRFIPRRK
jgi:hypothetical protein